MKDLSITVKNLVKNYKDVQAVQGIDFSVNQGEIFGFLGPNGAGKTTTIKMLCTLLRPTSGEAFVGGFNILKDPMKVRKVIGIIFQEPTLDDRLTAYENLKFHGFLYGLKKEFLEKQIDKMLELVELSDKKNLYVKTFSGGMKRRLELARGLLHTPKILFLDEPTLGLDPQTRLHIWSYLSSLKKNGNVSLFLTTHYLDEAENCDRIAIIDHGRIAALDTPNKLKSQVHGEMVILKTENNEIAQTFLKKEMGLNPILDGNKIRVELQEAEKWLPKLLREIPVEVESLTLHRATLEDVFIKLTGKEIREEEGSWKDRARVIMRSRLK
ncbi:MAG: ATP-binding cassette domain-containing protein [Firmicutes bacterium]|nr:ATP-binding cassette domain-containing protein [Bacillota bacterium]